MTMNMSCESDPSEYVNINWKEGRQIVQYDVLQILKTMKVQEEIGKEIDDYFFFIMHLSKNKRLNSICAIGLKCKKLLWNKQEILRTDGRTGVTTIYPNFP